MNVLSAVLLIAFAVIGIIAVIREISLCFFCGKESGSVLLVTPIDSGEDAEYVLRSALSRLKWCTRRTGYAVCLDCGMDGKTREVCEAVCREYGFARLMSRKEFEELLDHA